MIQAVPLTAIRMFAETLQLDRVDAQTRVEYLDTIVNETERLTRLLNNVLDFSKIEEGRKADQWGRSVDRAWSLWRQQVTGPDAR